MFDILNQIIRLISKSQQVYLHSLVYIGEIGIVVLPNLESAERVREALRVAFANRHVITIDHVNSR